MRMLRTMALLTSMGALICVAVAATLILVGKTTYSPTAAYVVGAGHGLIVAFSIMTIAREWTKGD